MRTIKEPGGHNLSLTLTAYFENKMTRKVIFLLIGLASLNSLAIDLEDLKNKPATSFEVGKLRLINELRQLMKPFILSKVKEEHPELTYKNFFIFEEEGKLFVEYEFEGDTSKIKKTTCRAIYKAVNFSISPNSIAVIGWPGLTSSQHTQLSRNLRNRISLQSTENREFVITC